MISKETQYRIYAGTKNNDFAGWQQVDVQEGDSIDYWTLDLGNGYFLDRVTKEVKKFFSKKKVKLLCVRRDRTVEDPDGEYKDLDVNMLFDVEIMISGDTIKFNGKNNSFILLSREPVDWTQFSKNVPKFEEKDMEENWSSFYR